MIIGLQPKRFAIKITMLLLAISFFNIHLSFGQNQDYVVTTKGDTITGTKLFLHVRGQLQQTASMKTEDKKYNFKSYQLIAAGKADGTIYHTKKILDRYQFAKLMKAGYLSYYLYSSEDQTTEPFSLQVLIKSDGTEKTFSSLAFRKRVSDFLSDCKLVKDNFENDVYTRKDLDQVIDDYNNCIEEQTLARSKPVDRNKMATLVALQKAVDEEKSLHDKKGIQEMLDDIKGKIEENEAIPGYLADALKSKLEGHPELLNSLEALL